MQFNRMCASPSLLRTKPTMTLHSKNAYTHSSLKHYSVRILQSGLNGLFRQIDGWYYYLIWEADFNAVESFYGYRVICVFGIASIAFN
jgi:hypothetical protein